MILEFNDLEVYRGKVAMVDGAFDPFHTGHLAYFKEAALLGLPLLCNVASDRYVSTKRNPFMPESHRAAIVDSIKLVDYTHINQFDTESVLEQLRPQYYVKGQDWEGNLPKRQEEICAEHGIEIVYLDTVLDSSSRILQVYWPRQETDPSVTEFEGRVFDQTKVGAADYDEEYFTNNWREGDNCYTLESRRKIEGRHPEVIKEVFSPSKVLDMGCGPGVLMFLLHEVGIVADGIDHSPDVVAIAPAEVRERIMVGSAGDHLVAEDSYDLVICREVFEHLTVLQVREAVRNICRISSKYVYITTRFHPNPSNLLDVTTQFEVDPTHITLLNKDFLRLLFVLEGFHCRPDLESRIDWMNKGRVLVYEKEND